MQQLIDSLIATIRAKNIVCLQYDVDTYENKQVLTLINCPVLSNRRITLNHLLHEVANRPNSCIFCNSDYMTYRYHLWPIEYNCYKYRQMQRHYSAIPLHFNRAFSVYYCFSNFGYKTDGNSDAEFVIQWLPQSTDDPWH